MNVGGPGGAEGGRDKQPDDDDDDFEDEVKYCVYSVDTVYHRLTGASRCTNPSLVSWPEVASHSRVSCLLRVSNACVPGNTAALPVMSS
jgi:hypothetical protein